MTHPVETAWSQVEWDSYYSKRNIVYDLESTVLKEVLSKHVRPGSNVFKLGCFPGQFLAYLGVKMGCKVNGLDISQRTAEMPEALLKIGAKVGNIMRGDMFTIAPGDQYDVVASFGLIEHFKDIDAVLRIHRQWLRPGGKIIVSAPNFTAVPGMLHRWLDRENFDRHVIETMNLEKWSQSLRALEIETIEAKYHGLFEYWHEQAPNGRILQGIDKILCKTSRIAGKINKPSLRILAPYMYIVGRCIH